VNVLLALLERATGKKEVKNKINPKLKMRRRIAAVVAV
jgi:hypothetical protein